MSMLEKQYFLSRSHDICQASIVWVSESMDTLICIYQLIIFLKVYTLLSLKKKLKSQPNELI